METLRIGIAGAGGMGGHHARLLSAREDVRVVSLFDTDPVAMNRMEKTLGPSAQGLNHYATLESMIDGETLDGIVIATPHTRHADQVRTSLEAGLHVLVEKPMADDDAGRQRLHRILGAGGTGCWPSPISVTARGSS